MDSYLLLKLLHILSAVVMAGTGMGIAFFMFMTHRSKNVAAIAVTTRHVVLADWLFTTPAVVLQVLTGLLLMQKLGYSFTSPWFFTVTALYVLILGCWLPVVAIQYKLRRVASQSLKAGVISTDFTQAMKRWTLLGIPAIGAVLTLFWMMVFKPLPVY